jgi:hypothetical protein
MLISLAYATPSGVQHLLARAVDGTGRLDPSFGSRGLVIVPVVGAKALTDSSGRIVTGGPIPNNSVSYVQRRGG